MGSGRKREKHHEMRWPHLLIQRPPAATRSPPPLRRRCTLLLFLSRPIPARTATETASAHPKPPEQGPSEQSVGRAGPPTSRGGAAPDPVGSVPTRGPAGSIGGAGDGRRRRGSGTRDPGSGRAPPRVLERRGAERSGAGEGGRKRREGPARF